MYNRGAIELNATHLFLNANFRPVSIGKSTVFVSVDPDIINIRVYMYKKFTFSNAHSPEIGI